VRDADVLERVDALQLRYARALDRRDMQAWAGCFAERASYICTTRENEEQKLPVAIMMDDTSARIQDRINAITKVWAGTYEDYTTRHFIQRLDCVEAGADLAVIESNFLVAYTTSRGGSEILASGVYCDEVDLSTGTAKFRSKKAVLDTVTTPRYLVYPL
jgi:3-phenylpropionate/cinnamic acid dioxygenase small subunit